MTFSLRAVAWSAFAVAVVLLVGSSIFLLRATHALLDSETLVAHTREVQTVLEDLSSRITQVTNSRRGFVITDDPAFLNDYRTAMSKVPADLDQLRRLTSDRAERQQEIAQIQPQIQAQLALMENSINDAEQGTLDRRKEIQVTQQSGSLSASIQLGLQKMRSEEDELLAARQLASHNNYQHTLRLIFASFIIALMLLVAEMFLLSYEFTRHRQTQYAAQQSQEIVNAFFSSSAVGFGILNSDFQYTRVNDVLPRMIGLQAEGVLGKNVLEVFGNSGYRAEAVLREVLKIGRAHV